MVAHYPVGIWLLARAECMGGSWAPTPQRCSFGCSVYRQCVLQGCAVKSNTTSNHEIRCRTGVAMHSATVQQPLTKLSRNSNPTIVVLQVEAEFVCKQNVIPFRCPYPPFIAPLVAQAPIVFSQK
ncbi:hypothetical protein TNCV_2801961 [Trichonephila clavipes]|nr:hypothetical protein TNCV_2801961 [Trichonephila clavipes]